jgi:hypothetical protein
MTLDAHKLAQGLTGKERAKLLITHWHAQNNGKDIFSVPDERVLLYTPNDAVDRECWHLIEEYRWAYVLWRKEVERIWQVLLLTFQNIATMRVLPDDITEHSFVMLDKPALAQQAAHNLREFAEYQQAIAEIEKRGDGLPLFDETTYKHVREWYDFAKQLRQLNNEWVAEFKLPDALAIAELPPREEYVKYYVEEIVSIADLFTRRRVALAKKPI